MWSYLFEWLTIKSRLAQCGTDARFSSSSEFPSWFPSSSVWGSAFPLNRFRLRGISGFRGLQANCFRLSIRSGKNVASRPSRKSTGYIAHPCQVDSKAITLAVSSTLSASERFIASAKKWWGSLMYTYCRWNNIEQYIFNAKRRVSHIIKEKHKHRVFRDYQTPHFIHVKDLHSWPNSPEDTIERGELNATDSSSHRSVKREKLREVLVRRWVETSTRTFSSLRRCCTVYQKLDTDMKAKVRVCQRSRVRLSIIDSPCSEGFRRFLKFASQAVDRGRHDVQFYGHRKSSCF